MPSEARLAEMLRQLLGAREDAEVRLVHEGLLLARHGEDLAIEPASPVTGSWEIAWRGEPVLCLGDRLGEVRFERRAGAGIAASRVGSGRWRFGSRRGGERIRLAADRPTRTLKNLLQEGEVPAWRRGLLPLLFEGECLVWVPGIGVSADYRAGPGEPGLEPRWTPAAPPETRRRP
jgi:tRNA(Ile)-lysidine synthase